MKRLSSDLSRLSNAELVSQAEDTPAVYFGAADPDGLFVVPCLATAGGLSLLEAHH